VGILSDDDGSSEVNVSFQLIQDHLLGVKIGFNETGTGLGQILPVIVAAFDLASKTAGNNRNRLCIIEQPELHLHPKMQAEVGSMLVEAHKHTGMQLIIETHSENLLLRLQKLVRSGVISSDDLSVIYVEPLQNSNDEGPETQWSNVMTNLSLDEAGDVIDPFPVSFADLRIQDLLG
jgi:predicted ATPase